ncbi:L-rhamnose mutarotase [Streptomyces sp. NPDC002701]|uniref:L-rhamnose mutarotase n=1 Tax=Streptomyces sp. NPDC002701 TaxID=3364661 RepID=UPI00368CB28C
MRVALHTKVRADRVDAYEAAHREVPAALTDAIRAAGATSWTIWRSGPDLFHLLECEDYAAGGSQAGLPVVWELP